MTSRLLFIVLLVVCISTSSGCTANNQKAEERQTMIHLNSMQDWCVGRYRFQLPKEAKIIDETMNYDTFKIESKTKATREDFNNFIIDVEKKYNTKEDFIKDKTSVETQGNIVTKIIWGHSTFANGRLPVEVYAFVYDQSLRTLFKITGFYSKKNEDKSINGIRYLVKNLKARDNNNIPTEKGICLKNGFIKDNGKDYKFTKQRVGFNFANAPSVVITAETEAIYKAEDNLLVRTEKNLQKSPNYITTKNQTKDLRKGEKTVNQSSPLSGLELVIQVPMEKGTGIIATWEHAGTVNSALDPFVSMTVDTARTENYVKSSSIPNNHGLQMYETILNSLKK
ncbi:T6SS immunity protein Tli4 family protein [Acinetobacter gyllenbergii]|uniref:T6SS immunity protein Tli4 family protein n=1 Tax=Acinetobacter gyllenbergii TaxID=134534 RepID=UPI0021CF7BAB|nr:T6SS immunity protein Tli4 family protein [Acinetobacter gyllenbergii]